LDFIGIIEQQSNCNEKVLGSCLLCAARWQNVEKSETSLFYCDQLILQYYTVVLCHAVPNLLCSSAWTAPGSRTRKTSSKASFRRDWRHRAHSPTLLVRRWLNKGKPKETLILFCTFLSSASWHLGIRTCRAQSIALCKGIEGVLDQQAAFWRLLSLRTAAGSCAKSRKLLRPQQILRSYQMISLARIAPNTQLDIKGPVHSVRVFDWEKPWETSHFAGCKTKNSSARSLALHRFSCSLETKHDSKAFKFEL
jgi:hypothetical protein